MRYFIYFALLILQPLFGKSQTTTKDPQNITMKPTRDPEYPKGEKVLYQEVLMNLKYSDEAIKKYVEGVVSLSFEVKTDSTISNCIVLSKVGYGIDEAVKKYVEKLKFSPGMMNGTKVKMTTNMDFPVKAH